MVGVEKKYYSCNTYLITLRGRNIHSVVRWAWKKYNFRVIYMPLLINSIYMERKIYNINLDIKPTRPTALIRFDFSKKPLSFSGSS